MTAHPCLCGGIIRAEPGGEREAVRAHNASGQHRAWRWPGLVLGPAPCHECGELLAWDGREWREARGLAHRCLRAAA